MALFYVLGALGWIFEVPWLALGLTLVGFVEAEADEAGSGEDACVVGRGLILDRCPGVANDDGGPAAGGRIRGRAVEVGRDLQTATGERDDFGLSGGHDVKVGDGEVFPQGRSLELSRWWSWSLSE